MLLVSGVTHLIAGCIASVWTCFLFVVDFTLRASASDNLKLHFTLFLCFVIIFTDRGIMSLHSITFCDLPSRCFRFTLILYNKKKRPVALRFSPFHSQHQPRAGAARRPSSHINRLWRTGCGYCDKQQYMSEFIPSSVLTSVSLYFLYSHSSECPSVLPAPLHLILFWKLIWIVSAIISRTRQMCRLVSSLCADIKTQKKMLRIIYNYWIPSKFTVWVPWWHFRP